MYLEIFAGFLLLVAVFWAVVAAHHRSAREEAEKRVVALGADLAKALADVEVVRAEATEHLKAKHALEDVIEPFKRQAEAAAQEISEAQDQSRRYFTHIEAIERERNQWTAAYHQARTGHAAAQAMMLNEIERLARQLGKAPEPTFRKIADDFRAEHDPDTGLAAKIERAPTERPAEPPKLPA